MGKGKQLLESDCKVIEPCVIVHGGAWSVPEELREISLEGVQQAAVAGYEAMLKVNKSYLSFILSYILYSFYSGRKKHVRLIGVGFIYTTFVI